MCRQVGVAPEVAGLPKTRRNFQVGVSSKNATNGLRSDRKLNTATDSAAMF